MLRYLGLYRYDVALITFFSYIIVTFDVAAGLTMTDIVIAFLISAVSFNFVYSFNSWADWKIDKVNKPHRPVPSGRIKPRNAAVYSAALLLLSLMYPFFVHASDVAFFLFLLIPLLGIVYSVGPRLKRNIISASVITSLLYVIPVALGEFMHSQVSSCTPVFVGTFIFCMAIIPLKDIEDIRGDKKYGCGNWLSILGRGGLLAYSAAMLSFGSAFLWLSGQSALKLFIILLNMSVIACVVSFAFLKIKQEKLYGTIIKIIIAEGLLFLILIVLTALS
jgi:4-hydroxybenzoate polyprenyltransferase